MKHINIVEGDITQANHDVIVNAANPKMLGGGGVDGAIHKAAGPQLLQECRKIKAINGIRCPFGEARITAAGNLNSKYVIHTSGPIYHREKSPEHILYSSYQNSLNLALEYNCTSIAFPAISCGAYGYPIDQAAGIAIRTCTEKRYDFLNIFFYLFGKNTLECWRSAYESLDGE